MGKFLAILFLTVAIAASAQQEARVLKEAGLRKLGVWLGTWKAESTDTGAAGKVLAVSTGNWSANGNFLLVDQVVNNAGVKSDHLNVFAYNASTDDYTLTLVGIKGAAPWTVPLAYRGDTLIFHTSWMENGTKRYNRTLNVFSSPTNYRYIIQNSTDSLNWQTAGEGRAEKVGR